MTPETTKLIDLFHRVILEGLLEKCSEPQVELFNRIFPTGVSTKDLPKAIDLCERTVRKNEVGKTPIYIYLRPKLPNIDVLKDTFIFLFTK